MAEDLLVRLGDRIRKPRKKHGWTQVGMAEKVGIDRSFLADVERG
jgi:transcriptional regulator with XRE-family HTH domain